MADLKTLQYPLARRYLAKRFWAIREDTLDVMCELLRMRSQGIELTAEEIQARVGAARRQSAPMSGAVAVIPLCGVIDQKIGSMSDISGGTSVDGFMKQFRQCVNDPGVSGIVLDVDSPGGNVSGVPEAAAEILAARGTKPIVAVADPMIASAAYYLSCAADEIVCMPSGDVGSIGVLAIHDDFSAQNEMIGYKPTYIYYGAYKTELNPDEPLNPDALAYQKQQIDAIGNDFVRFVAKARGLPVDAVRSDFGQGRMLLAKDALAAKMIDRIDTLDATIARVARMARSAAAGTSAQREALARPDDVMDVSDQALVRELAAAAARLPVAAGVVPKNVSEELAPKDFPWSKPTLSDFTDKAWNDLAETDKRRIAGHYAWAKEMPPASFGDLDLPHHRASDGKVVFKGVSAAAGRLDQADIPSADKPAVKAHLRHHYEQFKEPIPDSLKAQTTDLDIIAAAAAADRDALDLALSIRSRS